MASRSEKVECPICKSSPGEPCAALAPNGVTRLGYVPIPHSARQMAYLDAEERRKEKS